MAGSSIKVSILGDASPLEEAFARAEEATKGFAVVAAAALGGTALVLDKSVKAALSAQAATQQMSTAFKNAGLNAKDYSARIDQAEASGRKLGFTNTETEGALKRLITATGNVGSAMKDLGVAQDLARYQGISLESATQRIGSALVGNQVAVKQLGVTIPPVTTAVQALRNAHYDLSTAAGQAALAHARLQDKLATGEAIMAAVDAKTKGMAGTFSGTAAGGLASLSAEFDQLEVSLGNVFLPALGHAAGAVSDFLSKINDTKGFGAKMDVVFQGIANLAHGAWSELQSAFRQIDWSAVWKVVESGLKAGGEVLKDAFQQLPALAALAYRGLKAAFDAVDWGGVWQDVLAEVAKLPSGFQIAFGVIVGAVRDAYAVVETFYNDALKPLFDLVSSNQTAFEVTAAAIAGAAVAMEAMAVAVAGYETAVKVATAAQLLFDAALDANPIGITIVAIAALVGALVVLYEKNATVRAAIQDAWSAIKTIVETSVNTITSLWDKFGNDIVTVVADWWKLVGDYFRTGFDLIINIAKVFIDLFEGNWGKMWKDIENLVGTAWKDISKIFHDAIGLLGGVAKLIGTAITSALGSAWSGIESAASDAFKYLEKLALEAALTIVEPFSHLPSKLGQWARDMKTTFQNELAKLDVKDPLVNAINNSATAVGQAGHGIGQVLANSIVAGVQSAAPSFQVGASEHGGGAGGGGTGSTATAGSGLTGDALKSWITTAAKKAGLDPNAVLAVMTAEGGFSGAVGDHGTSFGPAQLHAGGALPAQIWAQGPGAAAQWAQSPAGLQYAINQYAKVARGQTGMQAARSIILGFEHPANATHDLTTSAAYLGDYSYTGTGDTTYGPPGSPTDTTGLTVKTKKPKAVPTYKLPPELEKAIKDAQSTFNTAITEYQKTMSDGALANVEQTVAAMQKELAKASALATGKKGGTALIDSLTQKLKAAQDKLIAAVQTANDKIITAVTKQADADDKAAQSDATKAASAFGKGQFSAAESYTRAQIASLTAAQSALQKVISTTLRGSDDAAQKAARAEFEKVTGELAGENGAVKWIQSVGKIMSDFNTQMKAETTKLASDTQQRSAEAALQSVGYFAASADQVTGLDQVLLGDAQNEASTITTHIQQLEAKVKSAPKNLQAGLNQQIAKLQSQLSTVNGQIVSDMGTVQQDLVSALQSAQQTFSTAISNLQTSLDSQIQKGAEDASGYTSDNAQLQSMQAADQLGGLTDALSKAQDTLTTDTATYSNQLDSNNANNVNSLNDAVNAAKAKQTADKAAGASAAQLVLDQTDLTNATKALTDSINATGGVTQDQITTDQAAVKSAQRALDEYNLQIKAQGEQATAAANAAAATDDVNGKLADWQGQLASGKIDLKTFQADIAGLSDYVKNKYGVNIDLSSAQFANVTAAAAGVVGAFGKLIDWINQTTGSNLPGGTTAPSTTGPGSSVPSGGQTPPDVGNTAGGSSTGPGAQNVGGGGSTPIPVAVVSVPPPTSTPVSGLTGHGPQLMAGGIVKALQGVVVPGLPRSGDYVPAMLNGGEMVLNEMQQSRLFAILNGRSGGWAQPGPIVRGRSYEAPPIVINLPNYVGDKRELMQVINDQLKRSYANGA